MTSCPGRLQVHDGVATWASPSWEHSRMAAVPRLVTLQRRNPCQRRVATSRSQRREWPLSDVSEIRSACGEHHCEQETITWQSFGNSCRRACPRQREEADPDDPVPGAQHSLQGPPILSLMRLSSTARTKLPLPISSENVLSLSPDPDGHAVPSHSSSAASINSCRRACPRHKEEADQKNDDSPCNPWSHKASTAILKFGEPQLKAFSLVQMCSGELLDGEDPLEIALSGCYVNSTHPQIQHVQSCTA